jgi:hypothetical protein
MRARTASRAPPEIRAQSVHGVGRFYSPGEPGLRRHCSAPTMRPCGSAIRVQTDETPAEAPHFCERPPPDPSPPARSRDLERTRLGSHPRGLTFCKVTQTHSGTLCNVPAQVVDCAAEFRKVRQESGRAPASAKATTGKPSPESRAPEPRDPSPEPRLP